VIDLPAALALAAREGLRVRRADLGEWGAAGALLAEYDRAARTISLNARVLARLSARGGAACAERFQTCAILHELYHHRHPRGGEAAAHAFAREHSGSEPREFEALLGARIFG
jgi:hypothetical protein